MKALIDEVDLSYVKVGQSVKIKSDSFIGRELPGEVRRIAPVIKKVDSTRVCEIEVDVLSDPDGLARIGAGASIYIKVDEKFSVPSIPVEAYRIEGGKKWVLTLEKIDQDAAAGEEGADETMIVRKREIETGILGINTVEVVSGLKTGELILARSVPGIEDGMEVVVNKEDESDKT